jgi:hypothetical protein
MPVTISCPQVLDASTRVVLAESARETIKRWRPSFESWKLGIFRSRSGRRWDLDISGPAFRRVFTLYGPLDDLPGLVCAHVEALLAQRKLT